MKVIGYIIKHLESGKFDKEGWIAFVNGVPTQKEEPAEETICEERSLADDTVCEEQKGSTCITSGTLSFVGSADATLDAIKSLLGNTDLKLTISWEAV